MNTGDRMVNALLESDTVGAVMAGVPQQSHEAEGAAGPVAIRQTGEPTPGREAGTTADASTPPEGASIVAVKDLPGGADPPPHELATLFPAMTPEEFAALKGDIVENGQIDPITTSGGMILDGVHRLRACQELGIEPRFAEWGGVGSPLGFVVGRNLHRRHLTESQRAMLAARIAGLGRGRPAKKARERAVSQAEAARMAKVGRTSVQQAKKVQERGVPELTRAVDRGEVSLAAAARAAGMDAGEQAEVMARGPAAVRDRARLARPPGRPRTIRADRPEADGGADIAPAEAGRGDAIGPDGADREWLEGLPLWAQLQDPAGFAREALAWRSFLPFLDRARRVDPGFAATLDVRAFRAHRPHLLAHLAALDDPARWKLCTSCKGSGVGTGPERCVEYHGDGFAIMRRVEA